MASRSESADTPKIARGIRAGDRATLTAAAMLIEDYNWAVSTKGESRTKFKVNRVNRTT